MSAPAPSAPVRPVVRLLAMALWLLLLPALAEIAARVYWRTSHGLGMRSTSGYAAALYPELRPVLTAQPSRTDSTIDVLLLGASTINRNHGAVERALVERLVGATGRRVRMFNLGAAGHTSRDSWYKYRALAGVGFDLVVLYDGFNEVRANNVPPELFRDDYSHYAYYTLINDILGANRLRPFALPYTLHYLAEQARDRRAAAAGHPQRVPENRPDSSWTVYGDSIRTAGPFRHNLEALLDLAAARREPVVIMTFATWFAPGYSEDAFKARRLDYTLHAFPIELWGRPANVAHGIAVHNDVLRALHAARPAIGFVDMAAAIPGGRTWWNDVCHLTIAGSQRFADALLPAALAALRPAFPADSLSSLPPSGAALTSAPAAPPARR